MGCSNGSSNIDKLTAFGSVHFLSKIYHQYIYAIWRERIKKWKTLQMSTALDLLMFKKAYGKNIVINELNLDIRKGERLILLGPSGHG